MKTSKKALILTMAAIAGTTATETSAAARAALADMEREYGRDALIINYTWNPFDGFCA